MGTIWDLQNDWRQRLRPASFRGVEFHVETDTFQGGRRTVVHEYPKRDLPYSEDMGRHALRYTITGYIIHGDRRLSGSVIQQRDRLVDALNTEDAGTLIHPSMAPMIVMCERFGKTESRQRGGYYEFEMQFVEAGVDVFATAEVDTAGVTQRSADSTEQAAKAALDAFVGQLQRGGL